MKVERVEHKESERDSKGVEGVLSELPAGQPSKRLRDRFEEFYEGPDRIGFLESLRTGASPGTICNSIGLDYRTFIKWMNSDWPRFNEFRDEVNRAVAEIAMLCEGEVALKQPMTYLTQGAGRLVNSAYNVPIDEPLIEDGTSSDEPTGIEGPDVKDEQFVQSLKELRLLGIDLNHVVDNDLVTAGEIDMDAVNVQAGLAAQDETPHPLEMEKEVSDPNTTPTNPPQYFSPQIHGTITNGKVTEASAQNGGILSKTEQLLKGILARQAERAVDEVVKGKAANVQEKVQNKSLKNVQNIVDSEDSDVKDEQQMEERDSTHVKATPRQDASLSPERILRQPGERPKIKATAKRRWYKYFGLE